jgi:hypothetical protein
MSLPIPNFNWKTDTFDRGKEIHLPGTQYNEYTLCGLDLAGDSDLHKTDPEETSLKADCEHCIGIVELCQTLSRRRWIKNNRHESKANSPVV